MSSVKRNYRQHRREEDDEPRDRFLVLRQWLNLLFMIMAVVGVGLYFWKDQTVGTAVIIGGIVVKLAECVLRLMK